MRVWNQLKNPRELGRIVWRELVHYWHGFRLFFLEARLSTKYLIKLLRGQSLSRRERQQVYINCCFIFKLMITFLQLVRTSADIIRLVPFSVFVIRAGPHFSNLRTSHCAITFFALALRTSHRKNRVSDWLFSVFDGFLDDFFRFHLTDLSQSDLILEFKCARNVRRNLRTRTSHFARQKTSHFALRTSHSHMCDTALMQITDKNPLSCSLKIRYIKFD